MPGMVIIGAGECGVRAAFTLRELGYPGEITLIGAEDVCALRTPASLEKVGRRSQGDPQR